MHLLTGELQPTLGDIRPHGHLKIGRFTQHFVDVLNLEQTPLEFFDTVYPGTPREDQRKYLGRFGISGKMQMQKMAELSDGQKSRVVFAKLGRDAPHILLLVSLALFYRSSPLKSIHLQQNATPETANN
jgi:ATP-binding cassette subfamily F protein 2